MSNNGKGKGIVVSVSDLSIVEIISVVDGIDKLLMPITSSLIFFNFELMLFKLYNQQLHKSPSRVSESLPAPIH